jgi:hypothetical protein
VSEKYLFALGRNRKKLTTTKKTKPGIKPADIEICGRILALKRSSAGNQVPGPPRGRHQGAVRRLGVDVALMPE